MWGRRHLAHAVAWPSCGSLEALWRSPRGRRFGGSGLWSCSASGLRVSSWSRRPPQDPHPSACAHKQAPVAPIFVQIRANPIKERSFRTEIPNDPTSGLRGTSERRPRSTSNTNLPDPALTKERAPARARRRRNSVLSDICTSKSFSNWSTSRRVHPQAPLQSSRRSRPRPPPLHNTAHPWRSALRTSWRSRPGLGPHRELPRRPTTTACWSFRPDHPPDGGAGAGGPSTGCSGGLRRAAPAGTQIPRRAKQRRRAPHHEGGGGTERKREREKGGGAEEL